MLKKIAPLFLALLIFLNSTFFTYAQSSDDAAKNALQDKIKQYEQKLGEIRAQKGTLSSQIQLMDTQIYLTELKSQETEKKITTTEKEIDVLGSRIDGLDASLDQLSRTMLNFVVNGYKQRNVSVFDVLLDSNNANDLMSKVKYYDSARRNNEKIMLQVQETKSNFEEQKDLREKKIKELDALKETLVAQHTQIMQQQVEKKQLLSVTQNDETTYQRLLEEARRQAAAFKQFVAITGVGTISANGLGTGDGGWYYSQRDERWAGMSMGGSSESVLDVGCFITSIAMVMRFYGASDFTPASIAGNSQYFVPGSAYMYIPSRFNGSWPGGKSYKNVSWGEIDSYLNRNVPVIAGVRGSSHYVVLKKVDGGNYIMNDPIYGPDKKVSDYYSLSGPFGVFE